MIQNFSFWIINKFQSFFFCFGHEPVRDQFKSTVLWRAHCHRVLDHFQSKRTQDSAEFEALFKDFTRAHQKYKINKSSAYQQISDSVTRLLNEQRIVINHYYFGLFSLKNFHFFYFRADVYRNQLVKVTNPEVNITNFHDRRHS